ncbi:MAG TPA: glutathione S-transferase family protein [Stellaceae bacterium]|nr:glutathione S-transferase family protein [Stellaceae bacterium]
MAEFTIYIGNKNYSSWSLRAWLMAKAAGIPFDEVLIPLWQEGSEAELRRISPTRKVPVLRHGNVTVWESLAIGEYLAELQPAVRLWPEEAGARAVARAASHEMHAGFLNLRRALPMNLRASRPGRPVAPEVRADLDRIAALWQDCRQRFGAAGRYLFGHFTIADAMYAPVVSRLRTYGIAFDGVAQAYADTMWDHPALQEWAAAARIEPMVAAQYEL